MNLVIRILLVVPVALVVFGVAGIIATWAPDRPVAMLTARWAGAPSQFVPVAGMQVHLRDEGPRDDPSPIVLLHGTSASLHTWDGWAQALGSQRRVIRFDLPAFGLTGPSPQNDYSIDAYVRFVVAVMDHLGVKQFVLAGNSLGGQIAWATASAHPARVQQLVLVDAGGYPFHPESVPIGFRVAAIPVLRNLMEYTLPRGLVQSSVHNVYGNPARVTSELVDRYYDLTLRSGNRQALVHRVAQHMPGDISRVRALKLPVLILWGAQDRLIPVADGHAFAGDIAGSKLVVFDDLGHVPHEEDPVRTVRPVQAFLGLKQAAMNGKES